MSVIGDRLNTGEVLLSESQFVAAMEEEAQNRTAEQEKAQSAIREIQMANLVNNIDSYVEQGMLDAEDAERLRKAHKVDEAVRTGRVDAQKGSKIRNSILSGNVRDKIERMRRSE